VGHGCGENAPGGIADLRSTADGRQRGVPCARDEPSRAAKPKSNSPEEVFASSAGKVLVRATSAGLEAAAACSGPLRGQRGRRCACFRATSERLLNREPHALDDEQERSARLLLLDERSRLQLLA
jgi:hypothetical protein